jgi:hypothetical protein
MAAAAARERLNIVFKPLRSSVIVDCAAPRGHPTAAARAARESTAQKYSPRFE